MITEPGLYMDVPEHVYHRDPVDGGSLSSTGARRIIDACPAKYRWEQDNGRLSPRSMDFGTAAHTIVLGTGKPIHVMSDGNQDFRSLDARIERDEAEAGGYIVLKRADYDRVIGMADALRRHPLASSLFTRQLHEGGKLIDSGGMAEVTGMWRDELTGVACRLRLDWLRPPTDGPFLLPDYKTTTDASPAACEKTVAKYGYHRQGEFYERGVRALLPGEQPQSVFVFQETTAPYLVTVVGLSAGLRRQARRMNRAAINLYAECLRRGEWPDYNNGSIYTAESPTWLAKLEGE